MHECTYARAIIYSCLSLRCCLRLLSALPKSTQSAPMSLFLPLCDLKILSMRTHRSLPRCGCGGCGIAHICYPPPSGRRREKCLKPKMRG
jgi:hypothetical protein